MPQEAIDASAGDASPWSAGLQWPPRSTTTQNRPGRSRKQLRLQSRPPGGARRGRRTEPDVMEQLKQLGELHEQNVLSDEEFEREKTKLLGQA